MKNTAAEFIRRAAFVDAHALLKDKRRYNDSLEPLHPCERPGERADNDWFKVKCLAEILLEEAKGGR